MLKAVDDSILSFSFILYSSIYSSDTGSILKSIFSCNHHERSSRWYPQGDFGWAVTLLQPLTTRHRISLLAMPRSAIS